MSNVQLAHLLRRGFGSGGATGKFTLPSLPYAYDALEPVISRDILQVHHQGHHQTYVNSLNKALETFQTHLATNNLEGQITALSQVRFNGGGHLNHSLYWENLKPAPSGTENKPTGQLLSLVERTWGSFAQFQRTFTDGAAAIQGSGYGWLAFCPTTKQLKFTTTANQDILQSLGLIPLLTIDVWEHSYYLQYKNKRAEYLNGVWKIIDWDCVSKRFEEGLATQTDSNSK